MGDTQVEPMSTALQIESLGLTVDTLTDELRTRFSLTPRPRGW